VPTLACLLAAARRANGAGLKGLFYRPARVDGASNDSGGLPDDVQREIRDAADAASTRAFRR